MVRVWMKDWALRIIFRRVQHVFVCELCMLSCCLKMASCRKLCNQPKALVLPVCRQRRSRWILWRKQCHSISGSRSALVSKVSLTKVLYEKETRGRWRNQWLVSQPLRTFMSMFVKCSAMLFYLHGWFEALNLIWPILYVSTSVW